MKEGHGTVPCAAHPLADTGIEDSYLLMHSHHCASHGKLRFSKCGVAFARSSLGVGGISGH